MKLYEVYWNVTRKLDRESGKIKELEHVHLLVYGINGLWQLKAIASKNLHEQMSNDGSKDLLKFYQNRFKCWVFILTYTD